MGAKTSKSANITASPKKEKEPITPETENHVNGDTVTKDEIIKEVNNALTEIESVKEEVKAVEEIINEKAEELCNDVKEGAKEVLKPEETKTPNGEGGAEEKAKVKKSFSLRKKLSFLRREKKVKQDKHKNGDVAATPEKKEEEQKEEEAAVKEAVDDAAAAVGAKVEEIKEAVKDLATEVKDKVTVPEPVAEAAAAVKEIVVETVEKLKPEEPKTIELELPKVPELPKVEENNSVIEGLTEAFQKAVNVTETTTKEVYEGAEKKLEAIGSTMNNIGISVKETLSDVIAVTTNGHGEEKEELSKEVSVAE